MSELTGIPMDTLKTWRSELQYAVQRVLAGDNAQAQGYDGKSVTYTPVDLPQMRSRIEKLTKAIGDASTTSRGPITPFF